MTSTGEFNGSNYMSPFLPVELRYAAEAAVLPGPVAISAVDLTAYGTPASNAVSFAVAPAPIRVHGLSLRTSVVGTFSGVLGSFDGQPTIGNVTATVDWGDGSSGTAMVTPMAAGAMTMYQASGAHHYTRIGTYPINLTIEMNDTQVAYLASVLQAL